MLSALHLLVWISIVVFRAESQTSIARNKPAFQVSTWTEDLEGVAGRAVDGSHSNDFEADECTHTKGPDANNRLWWTVDLGRTYLITSVAITNRGDCCAERLSDFDIKVGRQFSQSHYDSREYGYCTIRHPAFGLGGIIGIPCIRSLLGRYVSVEKDYRAFEDYMTLCEVDVYGTPAYACMINKCERCDEDAETCTPGQCMHEYAFNESTKACVACDVPNCMRCEHDVTRCKTGNCRDGYRVHDSGKACVACTALHCRRCDEDAAKCSSGNCSDGYGFDTTTKQCSPCKVSGCRRCDWDQSKCKPRNCKDTYGATKDHLTCKACDVKDCRRCDRDATTCSAGNCFDMFGVSVNGEKCVPCVINNCRTCDFDASKCSVGSCFEGFGFSKEYSACRACIPHCLRCDASLLSCDDDGCAARYERTFQGTCIPATPKSPFAFLRNPWVWLCIFLFLIGLISFMTSLYIMRKKRGKNKKHKKHKKHKKKRKRHSKPGGDCILL